MPTPNEETWTQIATGLVFGNSGILQTVCVDGKHIKIPAPRNSDSLFFFFFFFFKQTFSIVLLGVVDAKYRFVAAVIGSFGKKSDGGIFSSSQLGQRLENNTLNIPPETMYAAWYN